MCLYLDYLDFIGFYPFLTTSRQQVLGAACLTIAYLYYVVRSLFVTNNEYLIGVLRNIP
jgi:hypothetical protein